MFCSNCGKDCGEAKACPDCGAELTEEKVKKEKDLNHYYHTYKPDRVQAIMALRVDTGMSAVDAKKSIDFIFDYHEYQEGQKRLCKEIDGEKGVYCPKCESAKIKIQKAPREPLLYTGYYNTPIVRLMASMLRLSLVIASAKNANRFEHICLDCGHTWQTENKT